MFFKHKRYLCWGENSHDCLDYCQMLLCEYNLERYPEVPFSVKCNSEDIIPSALLVIHIKKKTSCIYLQ